MILQSGQDGVVDADFILINSRTSAARLRVEVIIKVLPPPKSGCAHLASECEVLGFVVPDYMSPVYHVKGRS